MNSIMQFLRRPWKMLLGILLAALACAILCVCLGQYIASVQTRSYVENNYTTVGLLTSKYMVEKTVNAEGVATYHYYNEQPDKVQKFVRKLPEYTSVVKYVQQSTLTSGYLPEVVPLNYWGAKVKPISLDGNLYNFLSIDPYTYAMFEIVVDEITKVRPFIDYQPSIPMDISAYGYVLELTGTITRVCSLQPGYADPTGRPLRLQVRFATEAEALASMPKPGERYLVCGADYQDLDAQLRLKIAEDLDIEPSEIDWSTLEWFSEELIAYYKETGLGWVANYDSGPMQRYTLTEDEGQMINSCGLTVCANQLLADNKTGQTEISVAPNGDMISAEEYTARYQSSNMVRLDGSAEDFLKETTDPFWAKWLNTAKVNDHAVPVLCVENLNAIAQFATQDAVLVEGRGFTQQEAANGGKVCVLSESLARANGLSVGDTVSMRFYGRDWSIASNRTTEQMANPKAFYFSNSVGFATDAETFEIVGLYRQKNEWAEGTYAFTPNTVFVPQSAVAGGTTTMCGGIYTSVVLKNGAISQLEQIAAENGLEGLFAFYDQGYSQIMDSLHGYYEVGAVVLRTGLALWLGIILLYLFLFPLQLRPDLNRMWELGTPTAKLWKHIFVSTAAVLVPAAGCGLLAAALLFDRMARYFASMAKSDLTLTVTAGTLAQIAAVQLLVALVVVSLFAGVVLARAKKRGRRK